MVSKAMGALFLHHMSLKFTSPCKQEEHFPVIWYLDVCCLFLEINKGFFLSEREREGKNM